jgi:membrane protease YdiL (CAAX protease family)
MLMVELNDKEVLPRAEVEREGRSGESNHDSGLRRIFFGAGGLRLGWSIALYWVMFGVIAAVENWWADSLQLGKLWSQMFGELGALVAAVIPALVMARIERRAWGDYGLPLRQAFSKLFWVGAVWGFMGITLLLEILHGLHAFDFGRVVLHGMSVVRYAIFWGVVFLLVGLVEEFVFRGYTLFTLVRRLGFWPAAALLSIGFGAIHLNNQGEAWTGALAAGLIGFFFCFTLWRTGSLWFAVGFHAAWDWGESFFYSVPDSGVISPGHLLSSSFHGSRWITGGSVGPEGSLVCFLVIAVVWVGFERIYPEVKHGAASKKF